MMSLLDSFYKKYNIMNRTTVDDPEGGAITGWSVGATVDMALDDPTQTQKIIAEAAKIKIVNNALFPIGTPIVLGTYLRSADDENTVYMVQTKPVEAPGMSGVKVLKAEVIETRLPA